MDVKKPDVKAILAKLSFLRNHLNMLVPILIAIVSIVPFVLANMVGSKLDERIQGESLAQARTMKNLADNAVSIQQADATREAMAKYQNDANQIEAVVKQGTLRPLLSTKLFPEPNDRSQLLYTEFAETYIEGLETMVTTVNGRDCPSETELGDYGTGRGAMSMGMDAAYGGGYGNPMMMDMPGGEYAGADGYGMPGMGSGMKIIDAICLDRALSYSVYVNPENLAGYRFWNEWTYETEDYALEDCWYWQLGYWIIEDVFDTIKVCNQGSDSVFTSPVKRLKEISFVRIADSPVAGMDGYGGGYPMMMSTRSSRPGRGGVSSDSEPKPIYVMDKMDTIVKPLTGRFSTESIDVVHFSLAVVVDARKVLWFMEKLCSAKEHTFTGFKGDEPPQRFKRNQITILESSMRSFQRKMGFHMLYRYGEDPVVELNLACEYLFDLNAYKEIIPEIVTTNLTPEEN